MHAGPLTRDGAWALPYESVPSGVLDNVLSRTYTLRKQFWTGMVRLRTRSHSSGDGTTERELRVSRPLNRLIQAG